MIQPHFALRVACAVVFAVGCTIALGCGRGNSISGSVTFDGQPVENGSITFLPADGQGPSAGAKISAGKYTVDEITAGEKIVQIVGRSGVPIARTTEELAQQANADSPPQPSAAAIPSDAVGNNSRVSVAEGSGQMDFHLQPPQ